ncbi:hypothetical protein JKF63_02471 [Porcisia hertigi]|uniref:HECT-type E3 ubiquitin transferase n=1 Tax=Porcisia hertigi TaxID=2761500 RepID=A0A836I425_9TRYP|nr:hypothetical protein JKF63_02471 [Porcisia hertigi]
MDNFRFQTEGVSLADGGTRRVSSDLIAAIKSPDPAIQQRGLQLLCDQLTMSSFISPSLMASIPLLVPPVLQCISPSCVREVFMTAARALTYILDAFPRTFETLPTRKTLVEVLLQHLRSIEDVELSEQCLTCLELITRSPTGSRELLRSNGVEAVLGFADFFTLHKQRQIWTIVQRLVSEVDESSVRHITPCLPTLRASITNGDAEIRQKAITTLAHAIDRVKADRSTVESVFGDATERIEALLHEHDVNEDTLSSMLSLLYAGVQWSAGIAASVIEGNLFNTLLALLQPAPVSAIAAELSAPSSLARNVAHTSTAPGLTMEDGEHIGSARRGGSIPPATQTVILTSHQRTIVCRLLASLLIPYRKGSVEQLERLEMLLQRPLLTAAAALAGRLGDAEEDEDYSTEEDDEEVQSSDGDGDTHMTLAELRERVAQEQDLKIETKSAHARCHGSSYICDGCGKSCKVGDWYRCNECLDRDYCTACVLEHYRDDNGGQHTYTDMEQVVEITMRHHEKLKFYRNSPHLLERVLDAVPAVVDVCLSSELVAVRAWCLDFLVSAVDLASTEQLLVSNITQSSLGEVLNNNLRGADLVCNALAVALANRLLYKVRDAYQVQFVRDGVKLSLQLLKQRCKVTTTTALTREARAGLTSSLAGWRTIVGIEASTLLHRFLDSEDEQATESLRRVVQELRQDHFRAAVSLLCEMLASEVTAFEFYSSGVAQELWNGLTRQNNIYAVMHLIAALSTSSAMPSGSVQEDSAGARSTPPASTTRRAVHGCGSFLSLFVRHLHAMLTLLDEFTVPTYKFISGVNRYFVVSFEPHRASVAVPGDEAEDAQTSSAGDSGTNPISPRQCIKARVPPISSVSAMMHVLQRELPRQENEETNSSAGDDGESVTNILPDLHPRHSPTSRDAGGPTRAATTTLNSVPANSSLWIRYGSYVLPRSMTMLQIMEQLVLPAAAASQEEEAQRSHCGNPEQRATRRHQPRGKRRSNTRVEVGSHEDGDGGFPSQSRFDSLDMMSTPGYSALRPVVLHYSTTPFNPRHYSFYQVADTFPQRGDPLASLCVRLPSQDSEPRAVKIVKQHLSQSFLYSNDLLSQSQRDILGLLGVLHAAVSNWPALLSYVQKQAAAMSENLQDIDVACIQNTFAPAISVAEFQHPKLNNKAVQQCAQILLAGQQRGTWAVKLALDCNFLFSYSTRKFLFDVGFTSTERSLIRMRKYRELFGLNESRVSNDQARSVFGQLKKESKRVWRENVLECAKKLFNSEDPRSRNTMWTFHFYNEVGWGDGPTREFYTLVSQQLRQRKLELWRHSHEDAESDADAHDLFPRPVPPGSSEEQDRLPFFHLIGRFIARALMDEHVPGLPLSPVLIRLLRGDVCGVSDVQDLSEELGHVLIAMAEASSKKHTYLQLPGRKKMVEVRDLALDFTLPGDDSVELLPDGENTPVTTDNMMAYCDAVTSFLLDRGVAAAVHALREGFHWYIPLVALRMLTVEELQQLIAGHEKAITREDFEQHSEANYGYTLNCKHVQWLFDILASFTLEEQKQFFLFLTGSAHLPVGGLSRLRPSFTIVRKTPEDASTREQDMLPSAMTCQNYLKLPQYNSKEEMEKKLRFAMTEGSGAFLLS